jgi:hypothetical protein
MGRETMCKERAYSPSSTNSQWKITVLLSACIADGRRLHRCFSASFFDPGMYLQTVFFAHRSLDTHHRSNKSAGSTPSATSSTTSCNTFWISFNCENRRHCGRHRSGKDQDSLCVTGTTHECFVSKIVSTSMESGNPVARETLSHGVIALCRRGPLSQPMGTQLSPVVSSHEVNDGTHST